MFRNKSSYEVDSEWPKAKKNYAKKLNIFFLNTQKIYIFKQQKNTQKSKKSLKKVKVTQESTQQVNLF